MGKRRTKDVIGVISDTHGLVRPEAIDALRGASLVLHGGDVGGPHVLEALRGISPVIAVRGNNDKGDWSDTLRDREEVTVGSTRIYLLHDLKELDEDVSLHGFRIVISGHSHRPSLLEKDGTLYMNPGSAGPRRFNLPISIGRLEIVGDEVKAEIIELPHH